MTPDVEIVELAAFVAGWKRRKYDAPQFKPLVALLPSALADLQDKLSVVLQNNTTNAEQLPIDVHGAVDVYLLDASDEEKATLRQWMKEKKLGWMYFSC